MRGLAWIVIGVVVGLIGIIMAITAPGARIFGLFLAFLGFAKAIYGYRQIASGGVVPENTRTKTCMTEVFDGISKLSTQRTVLKPQDSQPRLPIDL